MKNNRNKINEYDIKRQVEKLYNDRINEKLSAVDAAGQWGSAKLVPQICRKILEKIDSGNEDIILEIGCGSGVLGNFLKNKGQYFGMDISFEMLRKFQHEYNMERKYFLIQGDSEKLPFPDNSFSIIVLNGVIMYLHGNVLEKTMREIKRICKSDSIIFVGDNILPSDIYWEYSWFQNLGGIMQMFAKYYIKFRLNLAKKSSRYGGKWKISYQTMPIEFINKIFGDNVSIQVSESAARDIKKKNNNKKNIGNRRVDIVIKIGE